MLSTFLHTSTDIQVPTKSTSDVSITIYSQSPKIHESAENDGAQKYQIIPKQRKKRKDRKAFLLPVKVERDMSAMHTSSYQLRLQKMRKAKFINFNERKPKVDTFTPSYCSQPQPQNQQATYVDVLNILRSTEPPKPRSFDIIERGSIPGIKFPNLCFFQPTSLQTVQTNPINV